AYDWNDTAPLPRLLGSLAARGAIIAASSEGGLFEYGTDEAVVANLTPLARGGGAGAAGSVTGPRDSGKRMVPPEGFRLLARGGEGVGSLAECSGYAIRESRTAVMSEQVLLRPWATVRPSQ